MGKIVENLSNFFGNISNSYYNYRKRKESLDRFLKKNEGLDTHITTIDLNIKTLGSKINELEQKVNVLDTRLISVQEGLKMEMLESLRLLWEKCVIEQQYATIEQKHQANDIYDIYSHQLHGNGFGTDLYNEIMNLPYKR